MPENDHAHLRRTIPQDGVYAANPPAKFVELGLTTCFSFLRGASDAVDLASTAWALGYDQIGCADLNSFAGVVRMYTAVQTVGLRPLTGVRIALITGQVFLAYPRSRTAYGRLSALISKGRMHDPDGAWQAKGVCDLTINDVAAHTKDVILIAIPPRALSQFAKHLPALIRALPSLQYIAASYHYLGDDVARINRLDGLAQKHHLGLLATNDVLYHAPERRALQDVMTCIRLKTTIHKAGHTLQPNAERHLKSPPEMARLFARWPHALHASLTIAKACQFSLSELKYEYPNEILPKGRTSIDQLRLNTLAGAAKRYPDGIPPDVMTTLDKELAMIAAKDIANYILTIDSIVKYAREEATPPILCQGRGSAANSAVCYCLGITAVDPAQNDLLFERFISEDRVEPPDIDVDFEHERREEVIQHIYAKYGRHRAGLCATVIHYRPRSAIREVGKVMGLSEDVTGALAKTIWGSWGKDVDGTHVSEAGLDLSDPLLRRTIIVAQQMIGMPRHLGQHVGGFILTEEPLINTVPIGNGAMPDRTFIEWDKDDIEALGIFKVDILALGMLTAIRKSFDLIRAHYGYDLTLANIPQEDPRVYNMLCKGDSIGVFQVESRAQINMLPRLRPRTFYDLVIEVAIVRPGPIQGDMVHPYLRRRQGLEPVEFPAPAAPHDPAELKKILGRTLGVPIFQEQAMKIAMEAAEFNSKEANELRKAMATFRSTGTIGLLEDKMVGRMVKRGYDPDFAMRCFSQIKGFGEYGFPESHAASFAQLVYVSSWLKCHFPDAFCASLLNSQPMGFYAPAQLVRDAQDHGVEVRAPDVNFSDWDTTLEPISTGGWALRLGLRQIGGLRMDTAARIMDARDAPFKDIPDLQSRAKISAAHMRRLAEGDAMRSFFIDRRQALWEAKGLRDAPALPLFQDGTDEGLERSVPLPVMPVCEQVVADYQTMRLSLKAHPMSFLRKSMARQSFITTKQLLDCRNGQRIKMAGLVLIRQKPGTAKGVCFITIEDEFGVANLVVWPKMMESYRKVVMQSRLLMIEGYVQRDVEIIHVVATHLEDRNDALARLAPGGGEDQGPAPRPTHPRNARIIPKSRDFH
ncbi:MAG: error-prone DNA polymerase [Yoonia sp.]|jgi:error-prone DNA polymerase